MNALSPKRIRRTAPALAAALLALAAPVTAQERDWTNATAATEAGHRLGNPQAATQLVAFVSYTCPHCAEFEKQSDAALRTGYIRGGKVAVEMRHFIRNPVDLAAALATECGAPERFFARHHAMLAAQETWLRTASAAGQAQQQRWFSGPVAQRMQAIAGDLDFHQLMAPHGLTTAQLDRCLADEARARSLSATSQAQTQRYAVTGTPSFLINGRLLDGVHGWRGLQRALDSQP